ncbi:helix-turn-helix transcriptional regulator [Metallumcola ferriviriculae]|uniref:Helix-turn-helix transcriptional regulator n=1 Tax=Metallumcola ferriviriculae TaxID=3039180 RepID=A0AAU0UWM1_9FIRM|nr:helix-turn-helix transcriptional regulator [Desulfitibacteraceae bacterium MK1]
MDKEIMKGSIDILILSLIKTGDMYGYEIAKAIKEKSDGLYEMGEGTLYPALKRLETKKLLEAYWGNSEMGARRKYYRITKNGIKELSKKLEDWNKASNLVKLCLEGGR